MDKIELDYTIIGGGIIGLMTALEIKLKFPSKEVALLEAAPYLGDHSTGRNSGVLHAGLYYPYQSKKHLLCMEGIQRWKQDLCPRYGIQFKECGKILFAKDSSESEALHTLWDNIHKNGVPGIEWVASAKLQKISTFVSVTEAFFSKDTGILDVTGALKILSDKFESLGGMVAKNCKVLKLNKEKNGFKLESNQFEVHSSVLINAAGFYGPELRQHLGLTGLKSYLVKGNYISTSQELNHPHLFYPIPPEDLKGLGVHSTLDLESKVKFGPNIEDIISVDYSDTQVALTTMRPEIMKTFKGIDPYRLYWDYAGIRSKLFNEEKQKLETDFWIESPIPGYVECLGIESPGLTSAPAIAQLIINNIL